MVGTFAATRRVTQKIPTRINNDPVPLKPERLRGLREVKHLRQDQIPGVTRELVAQWENGHKSPGIDALERLAAGLDATIDYLVGAGDAYRGDYRLAAAKMAFGWFRLDPRVPAQQKDRCMRVAEDDDVLVGEGAPRTAEAWRSLAQMIDIAAPPRPPQIEEAKRA